MPLLLMSASDRMAAILNHIRINEIQECVLHQGNILRAMERDALAQAAANMASLSSQIAGGVHGFVAGGRGGSYTDHPLKTQFVIREFRMNANFSGLNAMIGTLQLQNVDNIRLSVQNHTLYGHRVCCFAACNDIDDLVNMWAVLNFATIYLSAHSADASTREELSKFAIDPFLIRENVEKKENVNLTPIQECAAKLLVLYFKGTPTFTFGSFMAEGIVFNTMLIDLFEDDVTNFAVRIARKNLELILSSVQIVYCIGPGFINLGEEPILVSAGGLMVRGFTDETDELVDAGAKKALEGTYLESFIGKLYMLVGHSEGLLVSSSEHWDGSAFHFDSSRFDCFYSAVLRQRLVVSDQAVFDGEHCKIPSITSKIVPKGRRSVEVARTIGLCTAIPIATVIPEYFATAVATKKHAVGRIPIVNSTSTGSYPVPGQAILEACSLESEQLVYQFGDTQYVSTAKGTIHQNIGDTPEKNLEIDPLAMYKIVVEDLEEITQRVSQL